MMGHLPSCPAAAAEMVAMKINRGKKKCHKVQYKTPQAAREALRELRHIGVKRMYRCPYHKEPVFHLTSESKE